MVQAMGTFCSFFVKKGAQRLDSGGA